MHFRRTGRIRTIFLAEGEGFEPSMTLPPYTLSRRASSTTPAPLLVAPYIITSFCLPAKASAYDYGAPQPIHFATFFTGFLSGAVVWCFLMAALVSWGRQWMTATFFRFLSAACGLVLFYFAFQLGAQMLQTFI